MRILKIVAITGLILAVSSTAGAITFNRSYSGPIAFDITDRESGNIYPNQGQGAWGPPSPIGIPVSGPLPAGIAAPGAQPGEDAWGVFRINTIFSAGVNTAHAILQENSTDILWQENVTDGKELVGIIYGMSDIGFVESLTGTQTIETTNFHIEVWEQPFGTLDAMAKVAFPGIELGPNGVPDTGDINTDDDPQEIGMAQGSLGRTGLNAYTGIGVPGGVAGAIQWLQGVGNTGFLNQVWAGTEFRGVFTPGAAGASGQAEVFFDVTGGALAGPAYPSLDSDWFWDTAVNVNPPFSAYAVGNQADIRAFFNTTSNNVSNTPAAAGTPFYDAGGNLISNEGDWTVTSTDVTAGIYAVPEPFTLFGVLMGVGGIAGYVRKRLGV